MLYTLWLKSKKRGGTAAYIDAENALDPVYATHLGVNIDDLLLSQPDTGEQGLQITDALVTSGAIDIVVIDSVAALVPRAEIEGEMGDAHVGLQARLMSQALRKLSGTISKTKTIAIFINQIREKVGVMFGNPETTPGGRALKFYATIRLEIRRAEQIKDGTNIIGNRVRIKVVKNKVAPPFKRAEVDVMYGKGISQSGELVDMAVEKDIINKSGSWYSYGDERIGQGRENAKTYLEEHQDMYDEVMKKFVTLMIFLMIPHLRLIVPTIKKPLAKKLIRSRIPKTVMPIRRRMKLKSILMKVSIWILANNKFNKICDYFSIMGPHFEWPIFCDFLCDSKGL